MSSLPRMLARALGFLLFIIGLTSFMLQMRTVQSVLTVSKKEYQTDRVYSQQTSDASSRDTVSSGEVVGQLISATKCNVEVNSRIDGGWYKTTVKYVNDHAFAVCVTNQVGTVLYEETLTNLNVFSASDFIGKGTYSVARELKPNGEVFLLKYTYVGESEEYS